ncbi:MAG: A/G-specific adenine glycosylase [Phycisphaeraceae bacterium]
MAHAISVSPQRRTALRRNLLRWYTTYHRRLPWRNAPAVSGAGAHPDPYHVLVSEAMLQQTQVATVIAYFERFIAAFPTLAALAAAEEQQVLHLWQGLGYYRRARHLHAAARVILADHGGQMPQDVAALLQLPGVGRYTAGAIASIGLGLPAAAVDGNVARVLARWFAIRKPIDQPAVREQLWTLAQQLVPHPKAHPLLRVGILDHPGDFNQALMELGALICTPRNPQCESCPVAKLCEAKRRNLVAQVPVTTPRRKPRPVEHRILTLYNRGRYLLEQRPSRGLWSNMWQLPTLENNDTDAQAWVHEHLGVRPAALHEVGGFTHQTTHRTIRFTLLHARVTDPSRSVLAARLPVFRRLDRLDDLPMSNAQRRAIAILKEKTRSQDAMATKEKQQPRHAYPNSRKSSSSNPK